MRVVVVGGVAAGMSAAARLRRLDEQAEIVVLEKGGSVSFANCGLPYHIGGVIAERQSLLVQTPESLKASLALDVRVFSEVTAIDRAARQVQVRETRTGRTYTEPYDKLVLATGAESLRPPMPGLDHPAIFELRTMEDMDRIITKIKAGARHAVVMGGYIGIEAAENLRRRGLEVTLVEKLPQIMGPLDPEMAQYLREHLELHGIRVMTQAGVTGFVDAVGRVTVTLETGEALTADMVIFALGSKPNTALAQAAGLQLGGRGGVVVNDALQTSDPNIYAGGDAVETADFISGQPVYIPLAGPANRHGRLIADAICGHPGRYRGTQGTSVLHAFDLTVATTGLNEKTLSRLNIPYRKVYLHPLGHAGYYPGTAPMHLKLLFSPDGSRILGAQIVGCDGVDKRIDVIATAMRGGLGVADLEHLELAYAPPYGSAKDPVNMAGFIAGNLLRNDVTFWYAEDYAKLPPEAVILDVRPPAEFSAWNIPGSVNRPLAALRAGVGGLDRSKPYFVTCKVGLRSYLAYRILAQSGFTVQTLAGGNELFRAVHPELSSPPQAAPALPPAAPLSAPAPASVTVDCSGLQCPGPLQKVVDALRPLAVGGELEALATDPGFLKDMEAWCRANGHALLEGKPAAGGGVVCRIRKGSAAGSTAPSACPSSQGVNRMKKTLVVFSGDLDKVMAALIIANGALAMGNDVTLFFTFWGLSALRSNSSSPVAGKSLLDRMFGWMLPRGAGRLKLSKMHMAGMGTAMMRYVMRSKRVDSVQALLEQARAKGARLVACSMSLDVMGLKPEELIAGVEIGGVASFLAEADQSNATLFV